MDEVFEMDDKFYDLLEKIKSNMVTKEDLSNMATKEDLSILSQKIVLIEEKMDKNSKALYDGYQLTYEKLGMLEEKVDRVEKKVEKHDVEIRVIKGSTG